MPQQIIQKIVKPGGLFSAPGSHPPKAGAFTAKSAGTKSKNLLRLEKDIFADRTGGSTSKYCAYKQVLENCTIVAIFQFP